MSKKIKALFILYLTQFLVTACIDFNCDSTCTYEVRYSGLALKAWDTSGFQPTEGTSLVYKYAFGLTVRIESYESQISYAEPSSNLGSLGFTSAMACDCYRGSYIYVDSVESAEILVIDVLTSQEKDITDSFRGYDNTTIDKLFKSNVQEYYGFYSHDYNYGFHLNLTDYGNIPTTSVFKVNVYLESGIKLTAQTEQIEFH